MPEAVMIRGTIRGEIMIAINVLRNGVYTRLRASDARVPRVVAKKVAKIVPSEIVINENNNDPRSYRQNSSKLLSTGFKKKFSVSDAIKEIKKKYEDKKFTESDKCYTVKWMKTIDLQLKSI